MLFQLIKDGRIAAIKLGRRTLVPLEEIERVIASACVREPRVMSLTHSALEPTQVSASGRAEQLRDQFGLLSPGDLAELIGVDIRTLAAWRAQGGGPDVRRKLGRRVVATAALMSKPGSS